MWPLDPEEARAPQGRQQRGVTQWAQESGHVLGGNSAVCLRQVQQRQCLPVPGRRSEDRFIWDSLKAARRRSVHQAATSRLCSKAASRAPGGKEEAGGRSVSRAGLATGCHVPSSLCSRPRSFPAMRGSATLLAAVTLPPRSGSSSCVSQIISEMLIATCRFPANTALCICDHSESCGVF